MKKILGLLLVILLVILDQVTKYFAQLHLGNGDSISIIDGVFKLHYLENTGAAFGMFQDKIIYFVIMTLIVMAGILFVYWKMPETKRYMPMKYTVILILAGALGNFIDRVRLNYVIDFLYFELIDFPIFNVADCYVTVGAILLIILFLFYYKEDDLTFLSKRKGKQLEL